MTPNTPRSPGMDAVDEAGIERMIAANEREIESLNKRQVHLREQLRAEKARAFIAATGLTKAQVQLSFGPGVPWHGNLMAFAAWVSPMQPRKRWCEWNGAVYNTAELVSGVYSPTPVRLEDLP